jgi:hypothetical protein
MLPDVRVELQVDGKGLVHVVLTLEEEFVRQRLVEMDVSDKRVDRLAKKYSGSASGECARMLWHHTFRNLVQKFWRTLPKKKRFAPGCCDVCLKRVRVLQRCHTTRRRVDVARSLAHVVDGTEMVDAFLKAHRHIPLLCCCAPCHKELPEAVFMSYVKV